MTLFPLAFVIDSGRCGLIFLGNSELNLVDTGVNALRKLALFEERRNGFADDAFGLNVRQRALPAVADFDAELFLLHRNDKDSACVGALFADLPGFSDANAVLINRFRLGCFDDEHGKLPACSLLERS